MDESLIIELPYNIPGLNGNDGLIRQHYMAAAKVKKKYISELLPYKRYKFQDKVVITYVRYSTHLMDWDNHCASFKHLGDALVKSGIIKDDNPAIVVEFIPKQIKVKTRKEQKTLIIIEEYEE